MPSIFVMLSAISVRRHVGCTVTCFLLSRLKPLCILRTDTLYEWYVGERVMLVFLISHQWHLLPYHQIHRRKCPISLSKIVFTVSLMPWWLRSRSTKLGVVWMKKEYEVGETDGLSTRHTRLCGKALDWRVTWIYVRSGTNRIEEGGRVKNSPICSSLPWIIWMFLVFANNIQKCYNKFRSNCKRLVL